MLKFERTVKLDFNPASARKAKRPQKPVQRKKQPVRYISKASRRKRENSRKMDEIQAMHEFNHMLARYIINKAA